MRLSLRLQLTLWYGAVLTATLVIFGLLVYSLMDYHLIHHHDKSLRHTATEVQSILGQQDDCVHLTEAQMGALNRLDHLVLIHEIAGRQQVFYRSPDLDEESVPLGPAVEAAFTGAEEEFDRVNGSRGEIRIFSRRYHLRSGRQGVIRVVYTLGDRAEAKRAFRVSLLFMAPLALLLAMAGGFLLAGRALRPVDRVTLLAREITATNLDLRLPATGSKDELGRLVQTLNGMIARLQSSFASMQRFTADASHELRTPLTILQGEIQLALSRERTPEEYRRTLGTLRDEVTHMIRLVTDLLLLARADAGKLSLARAPVRLDELVKEAVEALKFKAEEMNVAVTIAPGHPLVVDGDEGWLRQMIFNLLDNSIKHNKVGGSVAIELASRDGFAQLIFQDSGPGIPADEAPFVFQRFYKSHQGKLHDEGAGLGLSIARWVAVTHGGDIELLSHPGKGSSFTIKLPLP